MCFFQYTRPKPDYSRHGLDWIVEPGYSFVVFSTNKTMETNQKPWKTMKPPWNNHGKKPKTMRNHETTLKNHWNQPKTMTKPWNHLEKTWKPTKNHGKPWNHLQKPWKPTKNHEKPWNHLEKPWKPKKIWKTMDTNQNHETILKNVTLLTRGPNWPPLIQKRYVTNTGLNRPFRCLDKGCYALKGQEMGSNQSGAVGGTILGSFHGSLTNLGASGRFQSQIQAILGQILTFPDHPCQLGHFYGPKCLVQVSHT